MTPDLDALLQCLQRGQVEFVVIGGFAAVAYGSACVTQDVDVCCRMTPENVLRLQASLADLHPRHRMTPTRQPLQLTRETCAAFKNLHLDTDLGRLDCLGAVDGVGDFDAVRKCSVEIDLPAGPCRILSLDALIRAKEAMGRPKDRQAAMELRAIRERLHGPAGAAPGE